MTNEEFMLHAATLHHPLDNEEQSVAMQMANKAYAKMQDDWIIDNYLRPTLIWKLYR